MPHSIRLATVADAPCVAKVQVETWQSHYRGHLPEAYLDSLSVDKRTPVWADMFARQDSGQFTLIAEVNGDIPGFCSLGPSRDPDASSATAELQALYVTTSAQGRGIGSALMKAGLALLRRHGFHQTTLWVLTTNSRSIGFYESQGWVCDGTEKTDRTDHRTFEEIRYAIFL